MNGFHIDRGEREQLLKMIYGMYNWSIKGAKFSRILAKNSIFFSGHFLCPVPWHHFSRSHSFLVTFRLKSKLTLTSVAQLVRAVPH